MAQQVTQEQVLGDPVPGDPVPGDPVLEDRVPGQQVPGQQLHGQQGAGGLAVEEDASDGPLEIVASLSPSRANDFMACPLRYRFRTIDRLPEPSSPAAVRGTVVHAVLEGLFGLPSPERTEARAREMVRPAWESLLAEDPDLAALFDDEADLEAWMGSCGESLRRYFGLEDPQRLEPAEREMYVETVLDSRLRLRGIVDRVDVAAGGEVRVVDYKTGRSPGPHFEGQALFQMKFYALVLWRLRGDIPTLLQLIYLGNGEVLSYAPDAHDLLATERKLEALWRAISRAVETGDWRPRQSALCTWCAHQPLCPAFGGTPPPTPPVRLEHPRAREVRSEHQPSS